MARIDVKTIYPWLATRPPQELTDYDSMANAFAKRTIIEVDDLDWQGDSYRLLADGPEPGQRYGIMIFGWGSCSGCDALRACQTAEDVQELCDMLQDEIVWFNDKDALRAYVQVHDWKGDWHWSQDAFAEFGQLLRAFLDSDAQ